MDFNQILRMAGQLREQVSNMQNEIGDTRVDGESGGGLVRAVMNGRHELLELHIDPKTMVPSEVTLVEDLVRAAVNQASAKANDILKNRVAEVSRKLGVDPSMLSGAGFPPGF